MATQPDILCIGSVLWDVIGRSAATMRVGSDVPGRITRIPGGVALNIAMTLRRFGKRPALLTAIGHDEAGGEMLARCDQMGLNTDFVYHSEDLPTDIYMAIEGANGVIAAIADAHSLEAAGDKILRPLRQGPWGGSNPYCGVIALDGNLTEGLLAEIARDPDIAQADLRVAPASPGKAGRLRALFPTAATFYVNLEEAGALCNESFADAEAAAIGLRRQGVTRAVVTNGGAMAADLQRSELKTATPPEVMVKRVTGAGDTFMAAHIAAELDGANRDEALTRALAAAAAYVSGDIPN